ncbi:hypothetical protein K504DRAFT_200040 [Pleomassaria siparia CBS 279.74]|uniref:Uncharacterized protein n=1 Tax=Pleomassaria siparia CBS 279.74 TaxID=1314801 RepID=A0A6G1KI32_9PLEO|nr:hypothetical protein K504DRAFT_200040 [Pleomassaria siparia CBS 279.74]
MWKRLQGHVRDGHLRDNQNRESDKHIGNPVLVETTFDEDQLRHIPNVSDFQNGNYQPNPTSAASPQYDSLSPHDPRDYRVSDAPTVSSFYSQESPGMRSNFENTTPTHSGFANDVSPPSSPESDRHQPSNPDRPRRFRSMRDVSPVDTQRTSSRQNSNIPVLRKAPPGITEEVPVSTRKFWGGKVAPNSKVRWDEYSGEPTSNNGGRPGQVNPLAYAKDALSPPSSRPSMGYQVSISGPQDSQRTTTKAAQPWDRTSGRAEIVKPFKDKPSNQPLNFPRQAERKSVPGSTQNAPMSTYNRGPDPAETGPVAKDVDATRELDTHENAFRPTVPLKVGRNTPPRSLASPTSPHNPGEQGLDSYPSPNTPTNRLPPQPTNPSATQHLTPPPITNVVQKPIEGTPVSTSSKDPGPDSRFSWTTYNTNTTYQRSPPPSPPPPLPVPISRVPAEPLSAGSNILNRNRPLDKVPTRKPVSTATMEFDPPSPRPDSTFSTNTQKALPRPPTEISAADHVDTLEAQMEDLRIRRSNVFRLLQDLNNMAPANPLITDFKRMRLVDRRKKEFEDELAEIRREEHDVGLRLHRAYRKRENADPGSESAIWIRRVTR